MIQAVVFTGSWIPLTAGNAAASAIKPKDHPRLSYNSAAPAANHVLRLLKQFSFWS